MESTLGKKRMIAVLTALSVFTAGAVAAAVMSGIIPWRSNVATPQPASVSESVQAGALDGRSVPQAAKTRVPPKRVAAAAPKPIPCDNCGVIESIESFTEKGQASGGGAVAGGLIGGIIGHQIGKGRGKDLATVAGAVGGAVAGHKMEENAKRVTRYQVGVRMNNGTREVLILNLPPTAAVGTRVRIVNGEPVPE